MYISVVKSTISDVIHLYRQLAISGSPTISKQVATAIGLGACFDPEMVLCSTPFKNALEG